ncbi:MAG: IS1595 family transposase [Spirochaetaceae bacterium]|nr:IS1595 family transposase [Spirochaetaceae bacterium]
MTLFNFNTLFTNEQDCINHFVKLKYPNGLICPKCSTSEKVYRVANPKMAICSNCASQFSFFTGTIFEKSNTDLRIWFYAIMQMLNAKKGISAKQLQRDTGVTYKTAWRILHKIREAMGNTTNDKLFEAIVEIDETYIGGKPRKKNKGNDDDNPPKVAPPKNKRGRGTKKTPVVGVKERNSKQVYAVVAMPDKDGKKLSGKQLFNILDKVCKADTTVITDDFRSYNILDKQNSPFIHLTVNHSIGQFSDSKGTHTNGIESFWAVLKRGIYGMYHSISLKYMQKYINEFCFRANNRENKNAFNTLLGLC